MGILEIIFTSIGLAMDAFAVSICKGLTLRKINLKKIIIISFYFGFFQTIMPLIGYVLGYKLKDFIMSIDHWIVFILLGFIGLNMILESLKPENNKLNDKTDFKTMFILAIATSIDALAVGITFAFLEVNIFLAILLIGLITFLLCALGVKIGHIFGHKYEKKAQISGGVILILIGLKILLEHLEIIF